MQTRRFGLTGLAVPVIGQGTWNMERDGRAKAIPAIQRAIDLGLSHLDTAEMYGAGEVERIVGEAIAGRRDEVFLASKVLPSNASYAGTLQACERSLRRLNTDRLDLYMLHWPGEHPLEETLRAFEDLVAQGKIRFWGVSNFDERGLSRVIKLAGEGKVACNQVLYSLEERYVETGMAALCEQNGVALVAYSPLGSGRFPGQESAGGRVLAEIARARGATAAQVALSFLISRAAAFAVPKATRLAHVEENAKAGDLSLTPEEALRIHRAFPVRSEGGLPIL